MRQREYCPCSKRRLLALYDTAVSAVDVLAPQAAIALKPVDTVPMSVATDLCVVVVGSASCERLGCRLLRRNRGWAVVQPENVTTIHVRAQGETDG